MCTNGLCATVVHAALAWTLDRRWMSKLNHWHRSVLNACKCRAVAERKRIKLQQSEKDAEAMSLMQKLRVTWTSEEDSLVSTDALLYFQISSLTCICHSIFTISDIDSCVLAVES